MRSRSIALALLLAIFAAPSRATTLQQMSLEDLAHAAPAIARVRCLAMESRWERGRIWTFTTVEVTESLKGSLPRRITIRLLGGKVGHLVSKVDGVPRFAADEDVVLFLQPTRAGDFTVLSWAQGTFRIHRARGEEAVTQDTAGAALFNPATRRFEEGSVRSLSMRDFRERLQRALRSGKETRR